MRQAYTVAGPTSPGAGTWRVGTCAHNGSAIAINNNDWSTGWVQVTN